MATREDVLKMIDEAGFVAVGVANPGEATTYFPVSKNAARAVVDKIVSRGLVTELVSQTSAGKPNLFIEASR